MAERNANALLIAAAPDLLATLVALIAHLENGAYAGDALPDDHPMHAARAAVAKATGNTP